MPLIDTTFHASAPTCLAVGNFDGVHRGHGTLLACAKERAAALGVAPCVLTFDPHPAVVLGRAAPPLLTTLARRTELLQALGFEAIYALRFDANVAATAAEVFAESLLFDHLKARSVLFGENFRFGRGRAGDAAMMRALGLPRGVEVVTMPLYAALGAPVSSSRVRDALADGDVASARALLGRPHRIGGLVVHGDARGRTIGFPTANLAEVAEMLPRSGVYAVDVDGYGRGAMNIGVRPTVAGTRELRVEVNLLDFQGDLYGVRLAVDFLARIREEARFESLDALKAQIARDVAHARDAH